MTDPIDNDNIPDLEVGKTEKAFGVFVDSLSERLEELKNYDGIEVLKRAGDTLIDALQIDAEMFESPARAIIFTAIAKRFAERGTDDTDEAEFCHDVTALLAREHSGLYETLKPSIGLELVDANEEHHLAVLDEYTDIELTGRLDEAMRTRLMVGVRERLQVTESNEDPFEIRVLSVGGNENNFHGMFPTMPSIMREPNAPQDVRDEHNAKWEAYKEYEARLKENTERFIEQSGQQTAIPAAWVTTIKGVRYLCMPDPIARKVLDPDTAIQSDYYKRIDAEGDRSDEARELATLEHEYTHTQGGLAVDEDIFFGISFEEVRAEKFSGNRQGYLSAKQFLRHGLGAITGFRVDDYFEANTKGGTQDHFFEDLATRLGLDATLELAVAAPEQYVHESRLFQQKANQHLGGYDAILMRLYDKAEDKVVIQERLKEVAQRMLAMNEQHVESWFNVLRMSKLDQLAALYQEQLDLLRAAA